MPYIVILEGQETPISDEVATTDQTLRDALTPFYPEVATAEIKREEKDGTTYIRIVKRAGTKGIQESGVRSQNSGVRSRESEFIRVLYLSPQIAMTLIISRFFKNSDSCILTPVFLHNILPSLIESEQTINPAITLSWQLKMLELQGGMQIENLLLVQPEIDKAISSGRNWKIEVERSLRILKQSPPQPSQTPIFGF